MKEIFKKLVISILTAEARAVLKKYKPGIIAITGTVGKTSTKDAVYAGISASVHARKSQKSFNSEFGVPLTILGKNTAWSSVSGWFDIIWEGLALILLPHHYPEWLVLEVGADRPGDIESLTKWLRPDIVIVTKLARVPVHVEQFSSPEEIFREKGFLVKALKPGGTLVLNADDEDVLAYKDATDEKKVLFGKTGDISGGAYEVIYDDHLPGGVRVSAYAGEERVEVALHATIGESHIQHILAALAVCKVLGLDLQLCARALSREDPTPGRMRLLEGVNGSTIIDDTYNSSPVALHEALNALKGLRVKRKIAVLGDMLELGHFSADEHKKAGAKAAEVADMLVTVGIRSRHMAGAALAAGMDPAKVIEFDGSREAGEYLKGIVKEGDVVLVKGSQGVRCEKVVEAIMAHPEKKKKLLVRQDKEWERR